MAEKKGPPKKNERASRPPSSDQRTSRATPRQSGEDKVTEILFLALVGVAIVTSLANFTRGPVVRGLYVSLFHPTALSYYDSATGAKVYVSIS